MTKVALITGAAKRLGAQTARHLHSMGYRVVIHYHHSHLAAQQLCSELNASREQSATVLCFDLTLLGKLQEISDIITKDFGRLDVLVNNASSFYPTPVNDLKISDYNDLMATNMGAPLFLTYACRDLLASNNGVVINMCDIHASRPLENHTIYCMAKAGLVMMTHSLANELAPQIRVNGIAPGAIEWPSNGISEHDIAHIVAEIPLARKGNAKDIAQAIGYLVDATYVTGQILTVDGGRQHTASKGA